MIVVANSWAIRAFVLLFALGLSPSIGYAEEPLCREQTYDDLPYSVCRIDLNTTALELFSLDQQGTPWGNFDALSAALNQDGKTLQFAMNAGMFDKNLKPIGLYVEDGVQAHKLNQRDGSGNFHLKPNGVFFISGKQLGVLPSEEYVKRNLKPDFATQSGPMLVINGTIHPKFSATGSSYKIRNGVGMVDDHTAVFVISRNAVTFYEFAQLFRDELKCQNALFLDGSVSSLFSQDISGQGGYIPLGPMVGAYKIK